MRILLLFPLCWLLTSAEPLTRTQREAIIQVVTDVVQAGFPETQGATLFGGDIKIRATVGPNGEEPVLPGNESEMQESIGGSTAYNFTFSGLHVHTVAGAWLVALRFHYIPRPADTVDTTPSHLLNLETLTADAAKQTPFHSLVDAKEWLAPLPESDRGRVAQAMDLLVPITYYLKIGPDNWPAAMLLLQRAGWGDAPLFALVIADQRARNFWQLRAWREPDIAFDPSGKYPHAKSEEDAWRQAHSTLELEEPAVALRRALFRVFRGHLTSENPLLAPDQALACAIACCDPGDPQGNIPRLQAIYASRTISAEVGADAALADRLASWDDGRQTPRMAFRGSQGKDGSASMSTSFSMPTPSYVPKADELDALIDLLADERPSRWYDFSGCRSIGDNAWRAVTILLGKDPRILAEWPLDHPWTGAERKAAASAVQAWWLVHGEEQRKIAEEKSAQDTP